MDPTNPTPPDELTERATRFREVLVRLDPNDPRGEPFREWLRDYEECDRQETTRHAQPPPTTPNPGATASRAILLRLSDVRTRAVRWLWPGRIPIGKQTSLIGDPGLGKSLVSLDLAARVATGRDMPDASRGDLYGQPAGVVILSAEDDPADTIKPRLEAASADCSRIAILAGVKDAKTGERMPNLTDLADIDDAVDAVSAKLVIVDPLMAYVPGQFNSYKDQHMRAVLAPLCQRAAEKGFTLFVVAHLTKPGESAEQAKAIYRAGGSIGIAGNARSVLLAARDTDDPEGRRCVLAPVKCNLAALPPALSYSVEPQGDSIVVVWGEEVDQNADDLVRPPGKDEEPSKAEKARMFLQDMVTRPVPSEAVKEAAKHVGISWRTIERVKTSAGVRSQWDPAAGEWLFVPLGWEPPTRDAKENPAA
jgi:hypothetical protein